MITTNQRLFCLIGMCLAVRVSAAGGNPSDGSGDDGGQPAWVQNGFAETRYVISGTESRNNPLRRKLIPPRADDELFVRFRLRYEADSIDRPPEDEGEFFVLWLDK